MKAKISAEELKWRKLKMEALLLQMEGLDFSSGDAGHVHQIVEWTNEMYRTCNHVCFTEADAGRRQALKFFEEHGYTADAYKTIEPRNEMSDKAILAAKQVVGHFLAAIKHNNWGGMEAYSVFVRRWERKFLVL